MISNFQVAVALATIVWALLIPGFYRISLDSLQRQRPDIPHLQHPMAYVLAGLWPLVLVGAVIKRLILGAHPDHAD